MHIGGFQKLTLLDYPGQVACIVFTAGCNFRCPFCHNGGLVLGGPGAEGCSEEEILAYLERRRGILDGVVISGGEPLMQEDVEKFIRRVRALGYRMKLDTNGTFPGKMERMLGEGLLDYVAMDVKHSREKYGEAIGRNSEGTLSDIERSMELLRRSGVAFEFRTTLVKGIHREEDVEEIARWIAGDEPYFLQSYVDSGSVIAPQGLEAFSEEELGRMLEIAKKFCPNAELRG